MVGEMSDLAVVDIGVLFDEVAAVGAASTVLLSEERRLELLKEARSYSYVQEQEVVGTGTRTVRQQLGTLEGFPAASGFIALKESVQQLFERRLAELTAYPFESSLVLDRAVLQRYPEGSLGITAHRDNLRYINLICIVVIGGRGRFFVCADRSGRDSREIRADPGMIILMRAPGFMGSSHRPFHYVTQVEGERFTFGLRQTRRE
jgi:hypothetical protein